MDAKMTDTVNHPDHYARYRFECEPKDFTKFLPHPLASAVEYIVRAPHKLNELEDLEKAAWWLKELMATDGFWMLAPVNGEMQKCILLGSAVPNGMTMTDKTRLKYSAAAFALASECPRIAELIGKYPCAITLKAVGELLSAVESRVELIKEDQRIKGDEA